MRWIDGAEVRARLTYARCIPAVRAAMIAFSAGETRQLLRAVLAVHGERLLGVMPGALAADDVFGAKLVSVSHDGRGPSHQGVVVLFDGRSGAPVCAVDGGEITAIRTAAASAVATEALARPDARRLAVLGTGVQAAAHVRAIAASRPLEEVRLWGRDPGRAEALARQLRPEIPCVVRVEASPEAAVGGADIICTVTAARDPVLRASQAGAGAHINLVGSSVAGPAEIDAELVARGRYIADSREGALAQAGELLRAQAAGWVDEGHVAGEIGEVLAGRAEGRQTLDQITLYKSLGHVVQDLAAARVLFDLPP